MKLLLQIETFMIALLAVPVAALTALSVGGEKHQVLNHPDLGGAFRSDTTLRFMRRLHSAHGTEETQRQSAEATRSTLCAQHGFEAAERAGCVAFMRQACHDKMSHTRGVTRESCTHFFQEEQPGFAKPSSEKSKSGGSKDGQNVFGAGEMPDEFKDFQRGPQYNSKRAQKATDEVIGKQKSSSGSGAASSSGAQPEVPDEWQQGPNYDSKKAQNAADDVADDQKKAGPRKSRGIIEKLNPFGSAVGDGFKEAQKGPNYDKVPQEEEKAKAPKKEAPEEPEEPEEKEVPSVPGCRNSPKGWEDTKGRDCEDYAEGEWCSRHGGYGDAWLDEWGTFEDVANKGKSAKQACCVCGGGQRKDDESSDSEGSSGAAPSPAASSAPVPALTGPILGTKSGRALQEQGYSGELVAHEDQKTMTGDWGREFGPHAGHRDIKTICAENPGNEWCDLHGYYDKERSAASPLSAAAVFVALLLACLR